MILDSAPRAIIFLMTFFVGIGLMITEGEVGEYNQILHISGFFVLPPFLLLSLFFNQQMYSVSKYNYFKESLRDAFLCTVVVALFIPTINRLLPTSTNYNIDGRVVEVNLGKGRRRWILDISQNNGKNITLYVPRSQFPNVAVGDHFELAVKRGGLGFLYGPKK